MSDSFYFPVFSGLLTNEHKNKIGSALWEFLWLISKTTKEVVEDGETVGIVLGGKPVKVSEVVQDLGSNERTIRRNLTKLKDSGYIESTRTPYGEVFKVKNSKKFVRNRVKNNKPKKQGVSDMKKGTDKNVLSQNEESGQKLHRDRTKMSERTDENVLSNKIERIEKDIKTTSSKKYDEDNTYFKMATYFHERVSKVANDAGISHLIKKSNMQTWADDMRKLVELDQVDKRLAKDVMDWVTEDSFWRTNVLSARKLREKFMELAIKMNAEKKPVQQKPKPQYDHRDKDIQFQQWIAAGNDPDEFDWSN